MAITRKEIAPKKNRHFEAKPTKQSSLAMVSGGALCALLLAALSPATRAATPSAMSPSLTEQVHEKDLFTSRYSSKSSQPSISVNLANDNTDPFLERLSPDDRKVISHFGADAASTLFIYIKELESALRSAGIPTRQYLPETKEILDKSASLRNPPPSAFLSKLTPLSLALIKLYGGNIFTKLNSKATQLEDYILQEIRKDPSAFKRVAPSLQGLLANLDTAQGNKSDNESRATENSSTPGTTEQKPTKATSQDQTRTHTLIAQAKLLEAEGNHAAAAKIWLQIIEEARALSDKKSADNAIYLSNLADAYRRTGEYSKAEDALNQSLLNASETLSRNSGITAVIIAKLASLRRDQGNYPEAIELSRRSLRQLEKHYGTKHPFTTTTINNLALSFMASGRYREAEELLKRNLETYATIGGPAMMMHKIVALNNLTIVYVSQGKLALAKPLLEQSLTMAAKSQDPLLKASTLNNLALFHTTTGQYSQAVATQRQSIGILEARLGPDHLNIGKALSNLAIAQHQQGQNNQAIQAIKKSLEVETSWIHREVTRTSRDLRLGQLASLGMSSMLLYDWASGSAMAATTALESHLNRKGILQELELRQNTLLHASTHLQSLGAQIHALTQQLGGITVLPAQRIALQKQRQQLEAQLYSQLPSLVIPSVSPSEVAAALPSKGALVEFKKFQPLEINRPLNKRWGDTRYVALIVKPNGTIAPVQLGLAQPIDNAIFQALQASAGNTSDATALWGKVSQLVLQPLQTHLAGSRQWFLSPDGELNRVPFAAIPSPQQNGVPLAQAVQLRILTTGRDLVRLQQPTKPGQAPLVMANPSYDRAQSPAQRDPALVASSTDRPQQRSAELNATRWTPLPATQQEGQQVAALLGTTLISGSQATTSALQRSQGPRVLHVATHGFFAPDQDSPPNDPLRAVQDNSQLLQGFRGEDPQLRSGLVLAGANQPEADTTDDGYLTAAEATGLQLEGTELVVLSACSTAQGAIKTGEGVYGLQRSLTVAGARSTLLSLWKVDDAATAEFMQRFYKRLKAGEGRADALKAVQQEFRTDPALKAKGWDSVYSWGAWQLVGDWRPIAGL